MTGHAHEPESSTEAGQETGRRDAQLLQEAIHKSVSASPEAFLTTVTDVEATSIDYWEEEIASSTWVVIERGEEVVGIAVARQPRHDKDQDVDPNTARFIESVWIDPGLRGSGISERLMKFLFEVECEKNPEVRQFMLWVFDGNGHAIRLYERMGFKDTTLRNVDTGGGWTERKYQLTLDTDAMKAAEKEENEDARREDLRQSGVTYRVLGGNSE